MIANAKESTDEVGSDSARRELVERVVSSSAFAKSKRLTSLLQFVCQMALDGRSEEINEQRIGEEVFERSPSYDPAIDGIVRTQASRLRQRLELYFAEEGANEPVKIVIPRGSYVPYFEERALVFENSKPFPVAEEYLPGTSSPEPAIPRRRSKFSFAAVSGWILALLFALLAIYYRHAPGSIPHARSKSHPLWSHFFAGGKDPLFVPDDAGLVLFQGLTGHNLTLQEYTAGTYRNDPPESADPTARIAAMTGRRRYTAVVTLEAVQLFSDIAASEGGHLNIRYARDVRPNDLRDNDVILMGAPEANPWLYLFQPGMNFVFKNDRDKRIFAIVNRHPRGSEPAQWISEGEPENIVYAVVDYLPGLNEKRNALIVAGTAMTGTECALNFISDDDELSPFLEKIRRKDGTIPHFEVVLGTHAMQGNALKANVLAWRVLK